MVFPDEMSGDEGHRGGVLGSEETPCLTDLRGGQMLDGFQTPCHRPQETHVKLVTVGQCQEI